MSSSSTVPPPRLPGTRVDHYALGEPIAEGAMGAVYAATDERSGERVALKLLHGEVDDEASERFLREARAAGRVSHPGIVRVREAGQTGDGQRYLAMDLLEGETLEARLADPATTRLAALELLREAVDALAAAHDAGIVHRDLKPSNLFLARDPTAPRGERVTLIDFGIAKDHTGTDPRLTATGIVLGTPFYMSPEQARAHRELGPPTDVWAIGVMMYESVAGHVPFAGDSVHDVVIRACTEPHRPLAAAAPGVDSELARLVDDCLQKRADARPRDARALAERLDRVLGRRTVRAFLGASAPERVPGSIDGTGDATEILGAPPRRRRALIGLGLGALCLVGGAVAAVLTSRSDEVDATEASEAGAAPRAAPAPAAGPGAASPGATGPSATGSRATGSATGAAAEAERPAFPADPGPEEAPEPGPSAERRSAGAEARGPDRRARAPGEDGAAAGARPAPVETVSAGRGGGAGPGSGPGSVDTGAPAAAAASGAEPGPEARPAEPATVGPGSEPAPPTPAPPEEAGPARASAAPPAPSPAPARNEPPAAGDEEAPKPAPPPFSSF